MLLLIIIVVILNNNIITIIVIIIIIIIIIIISHTHRYPAIESKQNGIFTGVIYTTSFIVSTLTPCLLAYAL